MSDNDVVLLNGARRREASETASLPKELADAYFFAKHLLKNENVSHDDLAAGLVDGTHDGGLDGMYILVNGMCVRDDTDISHRVGSGARVHLHLIQVKDTTGFKEDALDRLALHLPKLMSLERDESELKNRFNDRVLEISRRFTNILVALQHPEISITVSMCSLRASGEPHPNVAAKGSELATAIESLFSGCSAQVNFFDAAKAWNIHRIQAPNTKTLKLAEVPVSTGFLGGYIGVASLPEYYRFLTDPSGQLDATLFDANVRDYDSQSEVNTNIRETLTEPDEKLDFWWLNNGVTIVADRIETLGKQLKLTSPQVVNGLQTSHEIFGAGGGAGAAETRSVLVKVIEASENGIRDEIIKATNSQTILESSSLRATDLVQRKIEAYLANYDLYYERRKNYYRNRTIPLDQLVSINQLGQAVLSTVVQRPHIARGKPSIIFESEYYKLAFMDEHPLEMYLNSILLVRAAERFLVQNNQTRTQVENFLYHFSCALAIALTRKNRVGARDIARLELWDSELDDFLLNSVLRVIQEAFAQSSRRNDFVLFDQVAKSESTTDLILERMNKWLLGTTNNARNSRGRDKNRQ